MPRRSGPAAGQRVIFGWTGRQWLLAVGGAVAISLVVAVRNYYLLQSTGRTVPLWEAFVGEIPSWLLWALLLPGIARLVRRFPPMGPRAGRNICLHLVVGLLVSFLTLTVMLLVRSLLLPTFGPLGPQVSDPDFLGRLWDIYRAAVFSFLSIYVTAGALVLALSYYREERERSMRESQLETTLARTERDLLRMQVHPHFLYNTLNAISALVVDDPHGARRMVVRLSDLLRISLDEDARHEVTLREELDFLERYIDIQQIRFAERLRVEREIDPETLRILLPRLLLQPLVENAIQHGIARKEEGGCVRIRSRLEPAWGSTRLVVEISDDGPGPGPEPRGRGNGTGMGLRNSAARLRQMYGESARLALEPRAGGGAVVRVEVPAIPDERRDEALPPRGGEPAEAGAERAGIRG